MTVAKTSFLGPFSDIQISRYMNGECLQSCTLKPHIEPQGTGVDGSIYPKFKISHIDLFAMTVAGQFTVA